jgi:hypothetical protein
MNWAYFALGVSAVLFVAWIIQVRRGRPSWPGLVASLGCLVTAGLNSAAPIRGLLDPNYAGYAFGLAHSPKGIGVTLVAGSIWLACAASALIAASRANGRALWIVAATCAAMLVIIGWPTVSAAVADPSANSIELGEYLTIPGLMGTAVLLALVVAPFAIGLVWAGRAAIRE